MRMREEFLPHNTRIECALSEVTVRDFSERLIPGNSNVMTVNCVVG